MVVLSSPEKVLVIAAGFGVVLVAIVLVVCVVAPFCPLHRLLPEHSRLRISPLVKRRRRKAAKVQEVNGKSELTQLTNGSTYVSYGKDIHVNPSDGQNAPLDCSDKNDVQMRSSARPTVLAYTRESTVDSTYSSMTPSESRPSTPVSSKSDPMDISCSSMDNSSVRSADSSPLYGSLVVSLQLSCTEDPNNVRLVIGVQEAQDLPSRDVATCGDPFFKVLIVKESRAFRKSKNKGDVLAEFETSVQRKTRYPIYNQKFAKELSKTDVKDCILRFAAFDKEKYANPTEFGETAIAMKALNLSIQGQPVSISLELSEPKQTNGEMQMGVMYLPTAERLAFSSFKISNLRVDDLSGNPEAYDFYIRIVSLHNGKIVAKKKTSSFKRSTPPSSLDESVAFDVPTEQIRNLSFVVVVVAAPKGSKSNDNEITATDGSGTAERCVGKVLLGPKARSTGLQHFQLSLQRPREQIVLWHVLR